MADDEQPDDAALSPEGDAPQPDPEASAAPDAEDVQAPEAAVEFDPQTREPVAAR